MYTISKEELQQCNKDGTVTVIANGSTIELFGNSIPKKAFARLVLTLDGYLFGNKGAKLKWEDGHYNNLVYYKDIDEEKSVYVGFMAKETFWNGLSYSESQLNKSFPSRKIRITYTLTSYDDNSSQSASYEFYVKNTITDSTTKQDTTAEIADDVEVPADPNGVPDINTDPIGWAIYSQSPNMYKLMKLLEWFNAWVKSAEGQAYIVALHKENPRHKPVPIKVTVSPPQAKLSMKIYGNSGSSYTSKPLTPDKCEGELCNKIAVYNLNLLPGLNTFTLSAKGYNNDEEKEENYEVSIPE